ncbi:UDP-N-acetylmuramyl peptide synthase [Legionella sp. CNM-4043-24]|uniref:UDP-N-acetylmuramyl peptide synthase n=1 Tax=Legionella sp. CNM-4043-24 TaxID=3421646 RepID=UPI00403B095A
MDHDRNLQLYYQGALELGLPHEFIEDIGCLRIALGKHNYYYSGAMVHLNEGASIFLATNKHYTNGIMKRLGCPVPNAIGLSKEQYLQDPLDTLIQDLNFPLVAKPMQDTGRGLDVLCNIKNQEQLAAHLQHLFHKYSLVQIEEFHPNLNEYRILILKKQVIGVVQRFGAHVTGDGEHSIEELVAIENIERERQGRRLTMSPMVFDAEYDACLEEQQLTRQSVLARGQCVRLCYTANTGRGGSIVSLGTRIHPDNATRLCQVIEATGLGCVGVDVLCEDINQPFTPGKFILLELNTSPDITIHECPASGPVVRVTKKILRQLIYRHPIAYLKHLILAGDWSLYFKSGLVLMFFLLVLDYLPR